MKRLILPLILLFLSSCSPNTATAPGVSLEPTKAIAPGIKAVYLDRTPGQLSTDDLQAHPEVRVAHSFDSFKQLMQMKAAIWIDKNAIDLISQGWLEQEPQRYYPLVLVGYNNPLYSFRDTLGLCCFTGRIDDKSALTIEPGFSVILREQSGSSFVPRVVFLKGYDRIPNVKDILDISNSLLAR